MIGMKMCCINDCMVISIIQPKVMLSSALDPFSAGKAMQSPQSAATPRILTLGFPIQTSGNTEIITITEYGPLMKT